MLPSLGFNEILILGVLALLVVGPKDLPLLFRKIGRWTAKLRGMAQEFRTGFDELARQAELDELKREVDALRRTTSLQDIGRELSKPLPTLEEYASRPSTPAPVTEASSPPEAPALDTPAEPYAHFSDVQPEPSLLDIVPVHPEPPPQPEPAPASADAHEEPPMVRSAP